MQLSNLVLMMATIQAQSNVQYTFVPSYCDSIVDICYQNYFDLGVNAGFWEYGIARNCFAPIVSDGKRYPLAAPTYQLPVVSETLIQQCLLPPTPFVIDSQERTLSETCMNEMLAAIPTKMATINQYVINFDAGLAEFKRIFKLNLSKAKRTTAIKPSMTTMQTNGDAMVMTLGEMFNLLHRSLPAGNNFALVNELIEVNFRKRQLRVPFSQLVPQITVSLYKTIFDKNTVGYNATLTGILMDGMKLISDLGDIIEEKRGRILTDCQALLDLKY